jgi:hypothetical protein
VRLVGVNSSLEAKVKKIFLCGIVLFFGSGFVLPASAQNAIQNGSISGRVTDNSGGVIAGANVTVKNVDTVFELNAKTNGSGLYNFPSLAVGVYTLTASLQGFKTTEVKNLIVQVGQSTAEDVTLEVGSLAESVEVTASEPLLRTTESTVSTVINQKLIEDLPLSGRRYTDFVLLTPNVNADGQFGLVSVAGQQGGADSGYANGNGSNSFTLDGANATSNYFGDARGRTRVPYVFGEQSIQEFQVADSPYSAAYGGAGTGFVNTVTKSGTDTFHGNAFYYNRNSATGANDAVDKLNGVPRPLNVLQQFGADVGGPILLHKLWFYFDYEQQRQLAPISVINSGYGSVTETSFQGVPAGTALPAPNGLFPAPSTFSAPPATNSPDYPTYLQQVSNALHAFQSNLGQGRRRRDDLSFFPKMDWQFGPNDHVTFVYNYNRFNSPGGTYTFNPVASNGVEALPNNYVRDHHATIHYSHIFSSALLNDLHVSFLRDEQIGTPSGLINPSLPTVNNFAFGYFSLGNPNFSISDTKELQWEIGEQVNLVRGRHDLRFGFDFNRTHIADFFPGNFNGTYSFNDLTSFALGIYHSFTQSTGNPTFPFTVPYYGFYVQDKYRLRKNLTLDLGLREDFQVYPQPRENPAFPLTGQYPNQYRRVAPRVGFSFQPIDKTVIRGGFGIFDELFNAINYENSVGSNGLPTRQATTFVQFDTKLAPNQQTPTFPGKLTSGNFSSSSNISLVDPGFRTPYILESSLEIQRELLSNTTLTVGTIWTHAVHLIASTAYDLNQNVPRGTTTYVLCPAGTASITPINPCNGQSFTGPTLDSGLLSDGLITSNFGNINALISPGVNNYNSLYLQLQRRVSNGLSVQFAYTFSKSLQSRGADFNNQFNFSDTHGPTLLDQRHRVSLAAVYSPDASRLSSDMAKMFLSHWTISTVMQFNSGRTYTGELNSACVGTDINTCLGGNTLNDSAANQSTGNSANGIAGVGPTPGIGFNSFYSPWIEEIDLGISRDFHITDRHIVTLKAQAFNLFNHPNYYVQAGSGIYQLQYDPIGPKCGDGATLNQTCYLLPDPKFKTLQSISELNGPRVFQFAFAYRF